MGRRERGIITPYEFQELRRLYTFREIAKFKGYTESGLFRWCNRNNVITSRIADWEIAEEIKNKTPKEIAYEYNVSLKVVYWRLKKMGISPKLQRGTK
jgi:hypothetical protein